MRIPLTLSSMAQDMFVLNNIQRSGYNQDDRIYDRKDKLIQYLYEHGYSTDVVEHKQINYCWTCDGEGCPRCNYTGAWSNYFLIAFTFLIGDVTYKWHLPREFIRFKYELTNQSYEFFQAGEIRDFRPTKRKVDSMLRNIDRGIHIRYTIQKHKENLWEGLSILKIQMKSFILVKLIQLGLFRKPNLQGRLLPSAVRSILQDSERLIQSLKSGIGSNRKQ